MAVTYTDDWEGAVQYAQFGYDVALDGDYVVIGRRNDAVDAEWSCGLVSVYTWNGSSWDHDLLVASDNTNGDHNGHRVDVSGSWVISGAPQGNAAYLFEDVSGTWTEEKILSESGGGYGESVAIDDDGTDITAVVGAPNTTNGDVYWYEEDEGGAGTWGQVDTIAGGSSGDNYGFDVDIAGNTTVVGSQGPDEAYVVSRSGGAWTADETLTSSTQTYEFGWSVSVSPDQSFIAVGDPASWSTNAGVAIFSESGGSWSEDGVIVADNEYSNQQFGISVACSNTHVIVGTNEEGSNPGTAQISLLSDRSLVENFGADGGGTNGNKFGWRVNIKDGGAGADQFIVDELLFDSGGTDTGKVWLIDLPDSGTTGSGAAAAQSYACGGTGNQAGFVGACTAAVVSFAAVATGLLKFVATGAVTAPSYACAGTGGQEFTATAAAASSPYACAAAGHQADISGSGSAAASRHACSGSGGEEFTGTGAGAVAPYACSSIGSQEFAATASAAAQAYACSGSGHIAGISGSGSAATQPFECTGGGHQADISGSASADVQAYGCTGAGNEEYTGGANASASPYACSGTGNEEFTGTGSAATAQFACTGSGNNLNEITGTGSAAASQHACTGIGAQEFSGPGTATTPSYGASGSGLMSEDITGAGSAAASRFQCSGVGNAQIIHNNASPERRVMVRAESRRPLVVAENRRFTIPFEKRKALE